MGVRRYRDEARKHCTVSQGNGVWFLAVDMPEAGCGHHGTGAAARAREAFAEEL
jgi:hypothetical protein